MPITSTFGAMAARGFGLFSAIKQAIDEYFEYVTLLLPGNGTNGAQNNTFLDSSSNNFTITRNGNTTQGTFAPYGANWSNYFDGTGDYLTVPDNAALDLGTGDYTIEGWVYIGTGITDNAGIVAKRDPTAFNPGDFRISYRTGTSKITFADDGVNERGTPAVTTNSWVHFAFVRSSGTLSAYANGVRGDSVANSVNLGNAEVLSIGFNGASSTFLGYISNVRIVKGTAVYSGATYTVPTAPLTAIANTSLLTCQSNRFRDNSTNNFTITRNGDVSVQVFSPFSPTASYDAATIGGSGYFDGFGDQLVAPDNTAFAFGTGDFTLEAWFYSTTGGDRTILTNLVSSTDADNALLLFANSSGGVSVATWNTFLYQSSNNIVIRSQWNHIALCRSGTTEAVWLNGTRLSSWTDTFNYSQTNGYRLGAFGTGSYPITGYISNARVLKGTAVYNPSNTTITVPTTPFTNVSNTSLLLNFTNAGVIDNAMMNDLETVGNAQISTSVSKFGGGSIALTAAGDYLRNQQASALWDFGTGNWTIEAWIYPTSLSTGANSTFYSGSASSFLIILSSDKVRIFENSTVAYKEYTLTLSTNTWQHIAIVRNGATSPTVYINGTAYTTAGGTYTGVYGLPTDYPEIGYDTTYPSSKFYGYIDDLRITKGVARYTANFTPPAGPFPTR